MVDTLAENPPTDPQERLSWTAARQAVASNPGNIAWVSANAGSGKTHVLTQRVIRLLLAGARPSAILCLTYTKAAASEMSNRVFRTLSGWALLDDEKLGREVEKMEGARPTQTKLAEARRLFARALDTPGGLKIQTIHAFCEALLHQFPLEANVAGHFSVLDDRGSADLLAEVRRNLLVAATAEDDAELAAAFATIMDFGSDSGLETLIGDIPGQRSALKAFEQAANAAGGRETVLRRFLGIAPEDTHENLLAAFLPLPGFPGRTAQDYIAFARAKGGSLVQETADKLAKALAEHDPEARARLLTETFFKKDGGARANRSFFSAAMAKEDPGLEERFADATAHVGALNDRLRKLSLLSASLSALAIANRLNLDYENQKKRKGYLDFEDLIQKAAELLTKSDAGPWIHFKLDQGIDHILVDEAQDTSPIQWRIIGSLCEEFFAGEGAKGRDRTLFAVGDEKQSIYSFQGARPEKFAEEGRMIKSKADYAGLAYQAVSLPLSFRSTEHVLSAVDQVFSVPANRKGLSSADNVVHLSNRIGHPGVSEVWDIIAPNETSDEEDWVLPFNATPESTPPAILARRIADTIAGWLEAGETVVEDGRKRPMRPGDILVLVRKRDGFANALTRALKSRRAIPVGGADRLVLTEHIAIQDLMAIGRFILLPEDDLSLAAFSKSPLINISEDDLMLAAARRTKGNSLWQRYRELAASGHPVFSQAVATISAWIEDADLRTPFALFARILGPLGGRRMFLSRLGSEASDVLDEFLGIALDHGQNGLPGLQSFISSLELEPPTIKREQDKNRDEVRIMTVHASKGLEAPVVFLIDDGGAPFNANHLPKLRLLDQPEPRPALPVWIPDSGFNIAETTADADRRKELAEEEYRRLLYVGMTRAADRLIVCGYRKKREVPDCWHSMVWNALSNDVTRCREMTFRTLSEEWPGLVWQDAGHVRDLESEESAKMAEGRVSLPDSLTRPLPPTVRLPKPLSPSGAAAVLDEDSRIVPTGSRLFGDKRGNAMAVERGRIMHRLFQVLPDIAAGERSAAAARYLERSAPHWDESERLSVIERVFAVLDDPALSGLFARDAKAEAGIMGVLKFGGKEFAVSGRIDRMAVEKDRVVIADFKTDRTPPEDTRTIPDAYVTQLAIYRAILAPLYENRTIECRLIYTATGKVFSLTPERLDAAMAKFD